MIQFSSGLLSLLLMPAAALAAAAGNGWGHAPTRLQLCQQEVQGTAGDERKHLLQACLLRRVEGEAGVAADCRRQLRIGAAARSAAQQRQLRDCEARALAVPSSQLPRRPPPPPPPPPSPSLPAGTGPAPLRSAPPPLRPTPAAPQPAGAMREGA